MPYTQKELDAAVTGTAAAAVLSGANGGTANGTVVSLPVLLLIVMMAMPLGGI